MSRSMLASVKMSSMSYLWQWVGSDICVVYCAVFCLVYLGDQCAGISSSRRTWRCSKRFPKPARRDTRTEKRPCNSHIVAFYHVQSQWHHLDPCVRRVLPLDAVGQDQIRAHIEALQLALEVSSAP